MTVDPSESNITCSEDYTLEESMCHILSFDIFQKTKGLFLVWTLGGFILVFRLGLLEFGLSLLVLNFCPPKSVVGTPSHLKLTLSSMDSLCKEKPPNIKILAETKNI